MQALNQQGLEIAREFQAFDEMVKAPKSARKTTDFDKSQYAHDLHVLEAKLTRMVKAKTPTMADDKTFKAMENRIVLKTRE